LIGVFEGLQDYKQAGALVVARGFENKLNYQQISSLCMGASWSPDV
jgi:hypothetical protein